MIFNDYHFKFFKNFFNKDPTKTKTTAQKICDYLWNNVVNRGEEKTELLSEEQVDEFKLLYASYMQKKEQNPEYIFFQEKKIS